MSNSSSFSAKRHSVRIAVGEFFWAGGLVIAALGVATIIGILLVLLFMCTIMGRGSEAVAWPGPWLGGAFFGGLFGLLISGLGFWASYD